MSDDLAASVQNLTYFKPKIQVLNLPGSWEEDIVSSVTKTPSLNKDENLKKESKVERTPVFPKSLYEYEEDQEPDVGTHSSGKSIRELLKRSRTPRSTKTKEISKKRKRNEGVNVFEIETENLISLPKNPEVERRDERKEPIAISRKNDCPPWLLRSNLKEFRLPKYGRLWLHNEILSFIDYIQEKPKERRARKKVFETIEGAVSKLYPNAETLAFGSMTNDLCVPDSDVDLVVFNAPKNAIHRLAKHFRSNNMVEYMEVLSKARIPIIKLRLNNSPYTADISFDQESGPRTGILIREIMSNVPAVRPLVILIKYFLSQRDLNETYRGGMGSHCCLMTVISMLQHCRRNLLQRLSNREIAGQVEDYEDLGSLLLEYFDLYGHRFNYAKVCIRLTDGGSYNSKPSKFLEKGRPGLLCVENPEDADLDIGKGSFAIARVRKAFSHSHRVLMSKIVRYESMVNTYRKDGRVPDSILAAIVTSK